MHTTRSLVQSYWAPGKVGREGGKRATSTNLKKEGTNDECDAQAPPGAVDCVEFVRGCVEMEFEHIHRFPVAQLPT